MKSYFKPGARFFCHECEEWLSEPPQEFKGYQLAYGGFYTQEELDNNHYVERFQCENGCEDPDTSAHAGIWVCGECGSWFTEQQESIDCCK